MPRSISFRTFLLGLALLAGTFAVVIVVGFFINLNSGVSDYSAGGISWTHQVFYNILHGRPFQSSLFATASSSVGFSHNPYPYINTHAIHVNFTPYLFAPLWQLWPTLSWLYGLTFLWHYVGSAYVAWRILRHLSPHAAAEKMCLATALLLSSSFFFVVQQKAQLLLFCGPFLMAAYYFLLLKRFWPFLGSVLLLCLTSEDAAMVGLTFALYLFCFERDRRPYAAGAAALAGLWLLAALGIIQPAARGELTLIDSTTTAYIVKQIRDVTPATMLINAFRELRPVLGFVPAFVIARLLYGKPHGSTARLLGLIVIAPLPHWAEAIVVSGGHHLAPVIAVLFLALVLMLGTAPDHALGHRLMPRHRLALLSGLTAVYVLWNFRVVFSDLPPHLRLRINTLIGRREAASRITASLAEADGNRRVLEVVRQIPPHHSLVFLTNGTLEGFFSGRSDLWRFPTHYDVADFLVLQRDTRQSFFTFDPSSASHLDIALAHGQFHDTNVATVSEAMVQAIIHELVGRAKTHRLVVDDSHVVLLERSIKQPIPIHPSTVGLGWLRYLAPSTRSPPT